MANNPIYPVAYTIKHNQVRKLYYLGFPEKWKNELLTIEQKKNPRFKSEYGLPTIALKKMVDSWMEGIVDFRTLKATSEDTQWLISTVPFTEKRIGVLFEIIKAWVAGTYIADYRVNPIAKGFAKSLLENMNVEEIAALACAKDVVLTNDYGTVNGEAYQAIPLLAVNQLLGKRIEVNGTTIHLCYAA